MWSIKINSTLRLISAFGCFINYILLQGHHSGFSCGVYRCRSSSATHRLPPFIFFGISKMWWKWIDDGFIDIAAFTNTFTPFPAWLHGEKNIYFISLVQPRESQMQLDSSLLRHFIESKTFTSTTSANLSSMPKLSKPHVCLLPAEEGCCLIYFNLGS